MTFTDREKEVLEMLVAGQSNKEIGAPLGIRERTVKAHVAKLMRKVGVHNPDRALGACHYALAGFPAPKGWRMHWSFRHVGSMSFIRRGTSLPGWGCVYPTDLGQSPVRRESGN